MINATVTRAGQSVLPQGTERTHILIMLVEDRPGATDRVVGVLRRRRARTVSLSVAQTEHAQIVRITALVKDSDVDINHLVEQLRKIVDVRQINNLTSEQAITRELVLIKVNATTANFAEVVEAGQHFGAAVVDATAETVTFEVVGSQEKLVKVTHALQIYGLCEVVRSGSVAIAR